MLSAGSMAKLVAAEETAGLDHCEQTDGAPAVRVHEQEDAVVVVYAGLDLDAFANQKRIDQTLVAAASGETDLCAATELDLAADGVALGLVKTVEVPEAVVVDAGPELLDTTLAGGPELTANVAVELPVAGAAEETDLPIEVLAYLRVAGSPAPERRAVGTAEAETVVAAGEARRLGLAAQPVSSV